VSQCTKKCHVKTKKYKQFLERRHTLVPSPDPSPTVAFLTTSFRSIRALSGKSALTQFSTGLRTTSTYTDEQIIVVYVPFMLQYFLGTRHAEGGAYFVNATLLSEVTMTTIRPGHLPHRDCIQATARLRSIAHSE